MTSYKETLEQKIFQMSPHGIKPSLPLIFKSTIPVSLLKPCRQIQENRLNNISFTISFRRAHRLPLFHHPNTIKCTCGTYVDIFGDHLLHCKKHSKIKMHNHMQKTIHFLTSTLGPVAEIIPSASCCKWE